MFDEKNLPSCPICGSLKVQKWGVRNGKQRFHCTGCFNNFIRSNPSVSASNQFVGFRKWVMERQVNKYLVRDSGMSQSTVQRLFHGYLKSPPTVMLRSRGPVHLLIDGTYFSNGLCLVLYYDHDIQYVQLFRETSGEKYVEILEDLQNLKRLGVEVYSVTCDGHRSVLKAVVKVYPGATVQRCVVHVKRQVQSYLSSNSQLQPSKELLSLSKQVTSLKTIESASAWIREMQEWYLRNKDFINQKVLNEESGRWWYKHKSLHRAYSHLANALPHLFSYLNDGDIPATTNELEGYFAHLKEKTNLAQRAQV